MTREDMADLAAVIITTIIIIAFLAVAYFISAEK